MASKDDNAEAANFLYYTLVALAYHNVDLRYLYCQIDGRRR